MTDVALPDPQAPGLPGLRRFDRRTSDGAVMPMVAVGATAASTLQGAAVTTGWTQILAARADRRVLWFQNTGAGDELLRFGSTDLVATPPTDNAFIPLASGGAAATQGADWSWPTLDVWPGAVWAKGSVASTIAIVEG